MRKLITFFMLTNVGKKWVSEAFPTTVNETIEKSKRKQYVGVLHQIDFIHLGDILFKTYQTRKTSDLFEKIERAQVSQRTELEGALRSLRRGPIGDFRRYRLVSY